ncbi:hypothetical protein [Kutzneria sp. NPDC051319]|uniref:hypothetical protein n=1 Tax=Kutzneria sp. NPDC051319 TaxID=3155047 RepID=UPI003441FDE8
MARNSSMLPMPSRRGPGRLIVGLILLALLVLALRDPVGTAHTVRAAFAGLGRVLDSFGVFVQQVKQ